MTSFAEKRPSIQRPGLYAVPSWVAKLALIGLTLLSILYLARGFYVLCVAADGATDLHRRWVEERYVIGGQNPNEAARAEHLGGYPPWAFFTGYLLYSLPWRAERFFFAIINLFALGLMFFRGFETGRPYGFRNSLLLALCSISLGSECKTLNQGQYAILITALLIASLWMLEVDRSPGAGFCLALAASKPNISTLFGIVFVVRRRWDALLACVGFLVVASLVIWGVVKTNPLVMLRQMLILGENFMLGGTNGPLTMLAETVVPPGLALVIAAVTGIVATAWLTDKYTAAPPRILFAIASFTGWLWTYHRDYDAVMLVFLLLALGELAIRTCNRGHLVGFLVVGLALWLPTRAAVLFPIIQVFQLIAWSIGLTVLLIGVANRNSSASSSERTIVRAGTPLTAR